MAAPRLGLVYDAENGRMATMSDKTARIGEILNVMKNTWDLPADCNEGELFAYAETLTTRSSAARARTRFTPISTAFRPAIWKCRRPAPRGRSSTARSSWLATGANAAPPPCHQPPPMAGTAHLAGAIGAQRTLQ
jgi:hypothetical protein